MSNFAASGSAVKYWIAPEQGGVLDPLTPQFIPIRFNTSGLNRDTTQIDSNEINPARQRPPSRQGTYSIAGEVAVEISFGSHDELLAAVMQSMWSNGAYGFSALINIDDSDNSINWPGGDFTALGGVGIQAADQISTDGFSVNAGNNLSGALVDSVTAEKVIMDAGVTLVTEASVIGEIRQIGTDGDVLLVGGYVPTFSIIEYHSDIGVYYLYSGVRIADLTFAAPLNSAGLFTFAVLGEKQETYTVPAGAVFLPATDTGMMVTTSGFLEEDDVSINYCTDYNVTVSNNMTALFSLFQREAYSVSNGIFTLTGSASFYFPDDTLYGQYLDEVQVKHEVELEDQDGNKYDFTIPALNYTQVDKPVDGPNEIIQAYTISGGYDAATETTFRIERIAA